MKVIGINNNYVLVKVPSVALVLHDRLELSPRPIISIEYEHRRYFNWFVVQ